MNKLMHYLAGLAGAGILVLALGMSLPGRPVAGGDSAVHPKAPAGCQPVAPGSYTFICEDSGTTLPDVSPAPRAPVTSKTPAGCRPVAPGSYTFICER
jgi:hypothetical protein